MNSKAIIGWVLVVVGLVVIGQAINASYQYFTGKQNFPAIFKVTDNPSKAMAAPVKPENLATQGDAQAYLQAQMQNSINDAVGNILPQESITKIFNIVVWLAFASFLVLAGGKICNIGIQLLAVKDV